MKNKTPKIRSGVAVAMISRHPRTQIMRDRRERRAKDAKRSWRRDANPDTRPSGPLFHEAASETPRWDRRQWSGTEQREALRMTAPDGYVYTCGGCGADMPDDEATYSSFHHDYVCKACAC